MIKDLIWPQSAFGASKVVDFEKVLRKVGQGLVLKGVQEQKTMVRQSKFQAGAGWR